MSTKLPGIQSPCPSCRRRSHHDIVRDRRQQWWQCQQCGGLHQLQEIASYHLQLTAKSERSEKK